MLGGRYFDIGVGVAPEEGKASEPVFLFDQLADAGELFGWQNAGGCGEFGAGDFSADGAGGDFDLWVVADALAFSRFAVGHEVEFVVIFGEPDRRGDGDAAFSESCQADVALALDFWGDIGHSYIVARPANG